MVALGTIVKVLGMQYSFGSIYSKNAPNNPKPEDYQFGSMVKINLEKTTLVGVITDISSFDPQTSLAVKMTSEADMNMLYPMFQQDLETYIQIYALGYIEDENNTISQNFSRKIPPIGKIIHTMEDEEIKNFHLKDGKIFFGYYSRWSKERNFEYAFLEISRKLKELLPDKVPKIKKFEEHIEFLSKIQSLGGRYA